MFFTFKSNLTSFPRFSFPRLLRLQQRYQITGTNPFDRAIQKVHKVSSLINYPLGHLKSFERICESKNIVPIRAVKDVETRWNSTYSMLARAVYFQEAINMWTR